MARIEESIEVDVPVTTAYNQWTQFEEFPQFMEGIESVQQTDDTHLLWTAEIAGKKEEWRAEITEQHPDHRVAWKATEGRENAGVVTFHRIEDDKTRVMVQMDWEPDGAVETVGAAVGADSRRVQGDLKRFKELIEGRGVETGAWRGDVKQDHDQ
ncbi:MAG TPA: SRPBCC family protein [Gaiellaceae bacterium]|nr:SRPBCC family protein [Gaiellaceae bacterium]